MSELKEKEIIRIGHGSGGKLTHDLIHGIIQKHLGNTILNDFLDSAVVDVQDTRIVFTTDSYIVKPLFFPGGDIGKLSVTGTINDLAMLGAVPLYLSLGLIIEEGFSIADLEKIIFSIKQVCEKSCVKIVTGDTKVVERGKGDGLYINTAGVGILNKGFSINSASIKPGDKIIINGGIGEHGAAIICSRGLFEFESTIKSDCAPLHEIVKELIESGVSIKFMRDPTRGGLATVLTELAERIQYNIMIEETSIPVKEEVKSICEFVGFDPLYLANEGKFIAVIEQKDVKKALDILHRCELGQDAALIGEIENCKDSRVLIRTLIGSTRLVEMMLEDQLPRIC